MNFPGGIPTYPNPSFGFSFTGPPVGSGFSIAARGACRLALAPFEVRSCVLGSEGNISVPNVPPSVIAMTARYLRGKASFNICLTIALPRLFGAAFAEDPEVALYPAARIPIAASARRWPIVRRRLPHCDAVPSTATSTLFVQGFRFWQPSQHRLYIERAATARSTGHARLLYSWAWESSQTIRSGSCLKRA